MSFRTRGRALLAPALLGALLVGCGPAVADTVDQTGTGSATAGGSTETSGTSASSGEMGAPACASPPGSCEACASWRVEYQGEADLDDAFTGLVFAPNGDVVAFGTENRERDYQSTVGDGLVVRYSPDGEVLWRRALHDAEAQLTVADIAFDASGTLLVAAGGYRRNDKPGADGYGSQVVRLDGDGEPVGAPWIVAGGVASLIPTDTATLIHAFDPGGSGATFFVSQLQPDGSLTTVLDNEMLAQPGVRVSRVSLGDAGALYLSGAASDESPWLAKSVGGELVWVLDAVPDVAQGWAGSVVTLADGSLIYSASARADETGSEPVLGRLTAEGTPLWSRRYAASGCCANGLGAIVVDGEGRVFTVGSYGLENSGLGTRVMSIDPCTGDPLWVWEDTQDDLTNFSGGMAVDGHTLVVSGSLATHHANGRAWIARFEL